MAVSVALQPKTVPGIGAGCIWLRVVKIPRHEQVQIPVAVDIRRDDPPDRRDLSRVRQRMRAEFAATIVVQVSAGEIVSLVVKCALQLRRAEHLCQRRRGEGSTGGETYRQLVE